MLNSMTRWQRRLLYLAAALAVYALLGFLLAPWLAERTFKDILATRLNLDGTVENLYINPFALTLEVDGLHVVDGAGDHLASLDNLLINFEAVSLFRWAWSFDEIHLQGPRLDFERFSETETTVSRLIDQWSTTAEAPEPATPVADQDDGELIRLVIADLQIAGGAFGITDQVPAEPFTTDLAPIDLAVTDFSTLPDASGSQQVTISTESGATVVWTGQFSVNPLALSGNIQLAGTYTPLLFRYFRDQLLLPVSFDGGQLDAAFDYRVALDEAGEISVALSNVGGTLAGLAVNQPDRPHLVEVATLTLSGGNLEWPEQRVQVEEVVLEGVAVDAYLDADGRYLPATPGQPAAPAETAASVDPAAAADPAEDPLSGQWQIGLDRLRLVDWRISHTDIGAGEARVVLADLDLQLSEISNAAGARMQFDLGLSPAQGGRLHSAGSVQLLPDVVLTGTLQGTDLALETLQPYMDVVANITIESGGVSFSGELSSTADEPYAYLGDFRVLNLSLVDRVHSEPLLSWQQLNIDRVALKPEALAFSQVDIQAPYARIEIEADGSTNLERTLITGPVGETPASEDIAPAAPPLPDITVGEIRLSDGSARFTDLALPLPFEASISALGGTVSTLASTSTEPARVELEGQVNEYGHVSVAGALQPFNPAVATDISIAFENVNLPRMSPYTIKFAGRKIDDGRTDLDISFKLTEGQLDGSNRLVIRDLTLGEKVEQPGAMDLPLDLAVALMKDPSGVVDFTFPVSGALDDPEFSYGGAVAKAFSNVILGLATSPFRLLGSLVGFEGADMEKVDFRPGRADLTPPQREVLDGLADALSQRPQLQLQLAPAFDPVSDGLALRTGRVDDEVAARLAEQAGEAGGADELLPERRLAVLENLFEERALTPSLAEIRASHTVQDESGATSFDSLAYTATLNRQLIDAVVISEIELNALAEQRAAAVVEELLTGGLLEASRITALEPEETNSSDDGSIQMQLAVSTSR